MSFSVTPILHSEVNKRGLKKILIRVIYNRTKIYQTTDFAVTKDQFEDGRVVNHPEAAKINKVLKKEVHRLEGVVISFVDQFKDKGVGHLKGMIKGKPDVTTFKQFCEQFIKESGANFSKATIANYNVLIEKVEEYKPGIRLSDIDFNFMVQFEASLRAAGKKNNTVVKNMQTLISLLNKARLAGMTDKGAWGEYKKPKYIQGIPTWLTEEEINRFAAVTFALGDGERKQAGYYYLLCCYAGYRIGTAKKFDYSKAVQDNRIFIRATKNNRIVSMPVHTRLAQVLEYCKETPFSLSEQRARDHVKEICKLAGIPKDLIFHSSRHSFAMLLMAKGFTIDEVAELIGDTPLVATVYARIHNDLLDKKIMDKLG